jgi:hypothetical protein
MLWNFVENFEEKEVSTMIAIVRYGMILLKKELD